MSDSVIIPNGSTNDVTFEQSRAANRYAGEHTITVNGERRTLIITFSDDPDYYGWSYHFVGAPDTHCGNFFYYSASAFFEACRDTTRD